MTKILGALVLLIIGSVVGCWITIRVLAPVPTNTTVAAAVYGVVPHAAEVFGPPAPPKDASDHAVTCALRVGLGPIGALINLFDQHCKP